LRKVLEALVQGRHRHATSPVLFVEKKRWQRANEPPRKQFVLCIPSLESESALLQRKGHGIAPRTAQRERAALECGYPLPEQVTQAHLTKLCKALVGGVPRTA
jgi:hypothetical protein